MAAANLNSSIDSSWARWLRGQLEQRRLSQADLIRASGGTLTSPRLSNWVAGKEVPRLPSIRAVCAALGIPAVEGMVAAGHLEPDDVGAVIAERIDVTGLTSRELLDELARRLVEAERATVDDTSTKDPAPLRRRVVPVVRPEDLGAEGSDWAALRQQD